MRKLLRSWYNRELLPIPADLKGITKRQLRPGKDLKVSFPFSQSRNEWTPAS